MIEIKKYAPTSHKIKALVYGASGSGKTSFAGTAKNVIFASAESGLLSIANKGVNYVEIKTLQDLKDLQAYLVKHPTMFDTVVIDSITEINDVIKAGIETKTGRGMQLQDWGTLAKDIKSILRGFRDLPMHVIFIAQESIDEKDENGTASKIVPSLNGKASTEIAYYMDIVGYVYITKTGEYKIITNSNPRLLTKDRSGKIGNDAPADFNAWIELVSEIKIVENQEVVDTIESSEPETKQTAPVKDEIGAASAKVKPPVKKTVFEMAKGSISKIKSLDIAKSNLAKIEVSKELNELERAELIKLYTDLVVSLQPLEVEPEGEQLEIEVIQA